MTTRDQLVKDIEAFLREHDMRPTMFGKLSINDPALMGELRKGRDLRTETVDRIRKYMQAYKPQKRKSRPRGSPVRAAA